MSTIDNMPRVKKALDNLREVLETERRDRIEFLRGSRADVIILDDIATDSEVFTLRALALTHEPFTPPRAGSKGYQRRQNQRWPKGR